MTAVGDLSPRLEAHATAFVKEHRLPGAAVGVVHGDELSWSAGVGFANVETGRAPRESTLYRVASITKTFTGTAIMQLRDEGRLHLDDAAVTYLPELRKASSRFGPIETVTIRRMLSHESGMMSEPPGTDWALPAYEGDPAVNLARPESLGTLIPPNDQAKYSNLSYQLLGEIVSRVSGTPYTEYLQANILSPLGLRSTSFEPLTRGQAQRRAVGYASRGFSDRLAPAIPLASLHAEGGLWSCVSDLARWISFNLREDGGERKGAQVLAGSSLAEMHRARYLAADDWSEAFGISWYTERHDGVSWVQHSGGLPGFITNVCFDPTTKIGGIALLNGSGDAPVLARELAVIARDAVAAAPVAIEPPKPLPDEWRGLLGLYADAEYETLFRLEWRDGELTFVDPEQPSWRPTLAPTDRPDEFMVSRGGREAGERCVFERRPDGRVHSLVIVDVVTLRRLDPVDQPG